MFTNLNIKKNILIAFTATILSIIFLSKSLSDENVFIVDNVKAEGVIDTNFSRDKYINKAFVDSFDSLISKILLTRDLNKINNIKIKKIKNLINSFQILDESYKGDKYEITLKIFYNDERVKRFLIDKNISFTQPKKISAIFYPALFVNGEIKDFNQNYFFNNWTSTEIKNELINFVLPIEDLDDLAKIEKKKNKIETLEVKDFVNKYDIDNYAFALIDYNNSKLKIHIKTEFEENKMNKNILYDLSSMNDNQKLNSILVDLKIQITDLWKEANVVNLLMPLSIRIKFNHINLTNLDNLKLAFEKISIVEKYSLDEFNINNSIFKIYYYGNPKKLKSELLKFGYELQDDQGSWEIKINE